MKTCVYAVFRANARPRPRALRGPDGRPVHFVAQSGLCAAVSPAEDPPLTATLERILDYERVVEALFRRADVVPMRFGSILESEDAVALFLRQRARHLRAQLRAIEGCVELGMRVVAPRPASSKKRGDGRPAARSAASPGRAYLQSRAGRPAPAEAAAETLGRIERCRTAVRGLYRQAKVGIPASLKLATGAGGALSLAYEGGDEAISLAFLVPRGKERAFRRAVDALGAKERASPLSGPWPPYSFVTG